MSAVWERGEACHATEEDRLTKKAKFKEDGLNNGTSDYVSFRDKVVNGERNREETILGEMDLLEILEEDVQTSAQDNVPSINFSERVREELAKPWRFAVVVKLLGRKVSYNTLRMRLETMWGMLENFMIIDLENDYYLVKLRSEEDMQHALLGGPWIILGNYLTVQKWSPSFNCKCDDIQSLVVWIRLPGMPVHYYNKKVIRHIGQMVGKVVRVDYITDIAARGKFARLAVEVQVANPLVSQFLLDGQLQLVEYECLPRLCYHCGCIGHNITACPTKPSTEREEREVERNEDSAGNRGGPMVVDRPEMVGGIRKYGDWMVVQRKGRPRAKLDFHKGASLGKSTDEQSRKGSRFEVLGQELGEENLGRQQELDTHCERTIITSGGSKDGNRGVAKLRTKQSKALTPWRGGSEKDVDGHVASGDTLIRKKAGKEVVEKSTEVNAGLYTGEQVRANMGGNHHNKAVIVPVRTTLDPKRHMAVTIETRTSHSEEDVGPSWSKKGGAQTETMDVYEQPPGIPPDITNRMDEIRRKNNEEKAVDDGMCMEADDDMISEDEESLVAETMEDVEQDMDQGDLHRTSYCRNILL